MSYAHMMGPRYPTTNVHRSVPIRKSVWGPYLWRFFHGVGHRLTNIETVAIRCEKTKEIWKYTKTLIDFIPCPSCRKHAATEYRITKYIDPESDNCDWYQKWAYQFHNKVNARLRKPVISWEKSVEISATLNALEQLQGYINSINGWKSQRATAILARIQTIMEDM